MKLRNTVSTVLFAGLLAVAGVGFANSTHAHYPASSYRGGQMPGHGLAAAFGPSVYYVQAENDSSNEIYFYIQVYEYGQLAYTDCQPVDPGNTGFEKGPSDTGTVIDVQIADQNNNLIYSGNNVPFYAFYTVLPASSGPQLLIGRKAG